MRCNCCTSAGFFRHAAFPFKLERFREDNDRAAEGLIFRSLGEIVADADLEAFDQAGRQFRSTEQKLDRSSLIDLE